MTQNERTLLGFPPRVTLYVGAWVAAALPVIGLALTRIAAEPPSPRTGLAIVLFFSLALLSDLRPVPVDERGKNEVSLAFVFIVAGSIVFGWEVAVLIGATSVLVPELIHRHPPIRALLNSSAYALAAGSTDLARHALAGLDLRQDVKISLCAFVGGSLFVLVNVLVVTGAVTAVHGGSFGSLFAANVRQGAAAFTIMAFIAALAANLWALRPALFGLLAGPLFTLTMYQRIALHSRIAARDARTDNLTGLGNHRAYQAAVRERIEAVESNGGTFSLCLVDVDNFKEVNDRYGHAAGDEVLLSIAEALAGPEGAEAFRFGGDEFAVLIDADETVAVRALERAQHDLAAAAVGPAGSATISVGIASFPAHAADADALQRTADGALYWSKRHGKNRACLYSPTLVRISTREEVEREAERSIGLRAAKNLVRFVDAKDPHTANHSHVVSELAHALGVELGLGDELAQQLGLAGLLHDIGKIGLPTPVLLAPRNLTPEEYELVKQHPVFGYQLLEGLDLSPVDEWVLHHHESWDGSGYPDGLVGEEIPLGSRIVLVADAFEAITADRPYRQGAGVAEALARIERASGSQFDPDVVDALERHLLHTARGTRAA